ncbi:MAG: sulfatase [Oscillospiraceae bacterium]|nr:sulfatase [Oscillospiraceae bacterium]MBQ3048931.1 sulfatase [Oscillospiraceae bacterium]
MSKKPNVLFFGIDSLRRNHMSLYGYNKLTTPHMDNYLKDGVVFENCFSPSIPTTPGYASMFTGMDCFSTDVVALRHEGKMHDGVKTMAEVLRENGYHTVCVGFGKENDNASNRGFDEYLDYKVSWGDWESRPLRKAESLNDVVIPRMEELSKQDKPFFMMLRHMDPHSPYIPPAPYDRMFFQGDEFDPDNHSLDELYAFKPFCDYFGTWFPPKCTSAEYINAQYDGEVAYMDACISQILCKLEQLGLEEETLVVFTSDHGETLDEHDCYYDHHGLYECTLVVPFALRFKGKLPGGVRVPDICQLKDVMPTILDILGIDSGISFDGRNLMPAVYGEKIEQEPEMYITECTWQRKHGWRTPEWKLFIALEPDVHYKPEVELYNLIKDPEELHNLADEEPEVVEMLKNRMLDHIAKREKEVGRQNPIYTNTNWNGFGHFFESSDEAYNSMHIGDPEQAKRLQGK